MSERFACFAVCAPGVEPALHAEARALSLAKVERQVGGVYFEGDDVDLARANLWLRTAVRVLRRLGRFAANDADELYRGAGELEWERFVDADRSIAVFAQGTSEGLDHSGFVAQRTKDALVDRVRAKTGARPDVDRDDPDVRVHVHLARGRATVSLDSSGASLHRRGWRVEQGRAPLAETTAAALVELSGWDRRAPLVDPFCGSGTIAIEAALAARNVAPGLFRARFGLERWRGHRPRAIERLRADARDATRPARKLRLVARDLDEERVRGARANAAAAGVDELVQLEVGDALEAPLRPGWNAWVVTNPPWGERVGADRDLVALYRSFGERLRERAAGYTLALLSGDARLADALRLPTAERLAIGAGGVDCQLVRCEVPGPDPIG